MLSLKLISAVNLHREAIDWNNRVLNNNGNVSKDTLRAVSNFCYRIDAANIRDKLLRLNLFCGNSLEACLVPLYRGESFTATQYGNTTDTNNNFIASDYVERGSTGGLKGNGSSKYLDTGFAANTLTQSDRHLSLWWDMATNLFNRHFFGIDNNACTPPSPGSTVYWSMGTNSTTQIQFRCSTSATQGLVNTSGKIHLLLSGNGTAQSYLNGAASSTLSLSAFTASSQSVFIFSVNRCGSPPASGGYGSSRHGPYSIGKSMDSTQATNFYNAILAFQSELSRT